MRRILLPLLVLGGTALAKPAASPIGSWRGTSLCTVKPSACHDEAVVYHVTAGTDPDSFMFDAAKLVDGREEDMGTIACHLDRGHHAVVCPIPKGTFTFVLDGDRMRGTLDLPDGTRFRRIFVERVR